MGIGPQVIWPYVFSAYPRNREATSCNVYRESLPALLT